MTVTWSEASSSVISAAADLIKRWHPHLRDARIGFIYRSEPAISNGRNVNAGVNLVPAKMQVMVEYDFMIWVAKDFWEARDTVTQNKALDHILCHCAYDDPGSKWYIRPHDIEEFADIIERYGPDAALDHAVRTALQLPLLEMERVGKVEAVDPKVLEVYAKIRSLSPAGQEAAEKLVAALVNNGVEAD